MKFGFLKGKVQKTDTDVPDTGGSIAVSDRRPVVADVFEIKVGRRGRGGFCLDVLEQTLVLTSATSPLSGGHFIHGKKTP